MGRACIEGCCVIIIFKYEYKYISGWAGLHLTLDRDRMRSRDEAKMRQVVALIPRGLQLGATIDGDRSMFIYLLTFTDGGCKREEDLNIDPRAIKTFSAVKIFPAVEVIPQLIFQW